MLSRAACLLVGLSLPALVPAQKAPAPAKLVTQASLPARIDAVLAKSAVASQATVGIHVVDLASGRAVYGRNERQFFLPASNMKLPTTALALDRLGPEFRFTTNLVREPSGDLVLAGSGDPSLSGRIYPYDPDAVSGKSLQAIEELADRAIAAGLTRVDGDIVGDDRKYPWDPYPPSWTQDDALGSDGAPVSALTLADNVISVSVRHGAKPGDLAVLSFDPPFEYFTIDNRVTTVTGSVLPAVKISRRPGSRQLLLWGTVPMTAAARIPVAVDDPAQFAAEALYDALVRRGIPIRGRPVARHRSAADPEPMLEGEILATRTSPPLPELLQVVDKVSQNLHAELLLREVGYQKRRSGTREAGLEELASMLTSAGATRDDFRLEDGSGLSRNAQITPRLLTGLLRTMNQSPYRDTWMSFLPIAGEDGTLAHRLCCSSEERTIRAKTGSLARAITLSGYADSKSQGLLAFSILVNNFSASSASVRQLVDTIALALVE